MSTGTTESGISASKNKEHLASFLVSRLTTRNVIYLEELINLLTKITNNNLENLITITLDEFQQGINEDKKAYPLLAAASPNRVSNVCKEAIAGTLPLPDGKVIKKSPSADLKTTSVSTEVHPRKEIHDFVKDRCQLDLFLQAYANIQNPEQYGPDNWRSFFRIGGIHGEPYVPYNGDKLYTEQNKGYCHHGTVLFPSWHRAYMLLMENTIRDEATDTAALYDEKFDYDGKKKADYVKAAQELRFPYLDWASEVTIYEGLPSVFTDENVTCWTPSGKSTFPNPLRSFNLPENVGKVRYGQHNNPYQYPYVPSGRPFTPAGSSTVRHPDIRFQTNNDQLNLSVTQYAMKGLRAGVWHMLQVPDYAKFSNHYSFISEDGKEVITDGDNYGHYASLEVVHDMVHDALGGTGGHMSYPAVAGFDPIFFIHHCNVDRLYALWQACYPKEKIPSSDVPDGTASIPAGSKADAKTPLAPFYKGKNDPIISDDVIDHTQWGYDYPELIEERKRQEKDKKTGEKDELSLLDRLLLKYHPDGHYEVRWQLTFSAIPKRALGGPFVIYAFLDAPQVADPKNPWNPKYLRLPNYAGAVYVFARDKEDPCPTCKFKDTIRGVIDLTDCMHKLGLNINSESALLTPTDGRASSEHPDGPTNPDGPPPSSLATEPINNPTALQVIAVKDGQKVDLKLVGIDPSTIHVEYYQQIADSVVDEKETKKPFEKLRPLFPFSQMTIGTQLAQRVVEKIADAGITKIIRPKIKRIFRKVPTLNLITT